jgi:outer membrane biosynthesis protein TonB
VFERTLAGAILVTALLAFAAARQPVHRAQPVDPIQLQTLAAEAPPTPTPGPTADPTPAPEPPPADPTPAPPTDPTPATPTPADQPPA